MQAVLLAGLLIAIASGSMRAPLAEEIAFDACEASVANELAERCVLHEGA